MKIMTIVPAFNEEKNIYVVVKAIKDSNSNVDVIVVNDGSKDRTSEMARAAGACVIDLPQNVGIGGAVQTGYIYALYNNYDVAVQVDGDGQHNPKDLKKLIDVLEKDEADMVIGSRFVDKTSYKSSPARKIGIMYFSKIVSKIIGKSVYDTTSGYRAVNRKVIKLFVDYYPQDYPEVETIVYAAGKGIRIKEVSVNMNKRKTGKSSITPLRSIYYMIKVTLALVLQP